LTSGARLLIFDRLYASVMAASTYHFLHSGLHVRDHLKFLIFLVFSLCLSLSPAFAHATIRSEYEVKAAFLYNFTRFVAWPELESAPGGTPLNLCIFGTDPFGDLLDPIRERKSQGRELELQYPNELSGINDCQVLFISESQQRGLSGVLEIARKHRVLTVSDMPEFVNRGGMIGYVKQGNVIRFEINLKAATDAGLTINSRLLELAIRVLK